MVRAQHALAGFIQADPRDLVFLPNATAACNIVLRTLALGRGDYVMVTDLTYPAVKSAAARATGSAGAGLIEVRIAGVLEDEHALLARFQAGLRAGRGRTKLAIIDHIISPLPVHLPVAALCALCRAAGVPTLVDGAHAVGAVSLDLPALGATYYTSNLHKWMCTPKGAAFLWVERSAQAGLAPLVTSHGYRLGFQAEFFWSGTRDYTALLTIPAAVEVLRALGLERAAVYRSSLLAQAAGLLMKAWGTTQVLGLGPSEACMAAVELPPLVMAPAHHSRRDGGGGDEGSAPHEVRPPPPQQAPSSGTAAALHELLRERFRVEVPVLCMRGMLWVRISAQIYNELEDYCRLAGAVQEVQRLGLLAAGLWGL